MNKININLNPRREEEGSLLTQKIISYFPLVVLVAAGFLILILVFQLIIFFKINTYNHYKNQWQNWEEKFNLITKIKKETVSLMQEKKEFDRITTPHIMIADILSDIFSSLPENIWFKTLAFRENSLILEGYVVKWDEDYLISLDKFINSLKNRKYFSDIFKKINIKSSQKEKFNGVEVIGFNIECTS
jgi:Tfp pilus assembly protein PilN